MTTSRPASPQSQLPAAAADLDALIERLEQIAADLPAAAVDLDRAARGSKRVRQRLEEAAKLIHQLSHQLDSVRRPTAVFDPSNPALVGRMIALALSAQPRNRFGEIDAFYGAGIYAIYYRGDFKPYKPIQATEHPIYVGKADPQNDRARDPVDQGKKLFDRIGEHAKSIGKAHSTLGIDDFEVRYLVVSSGWQRAAEEYMIRLMKPIWNSEIKIAFGIGKHGDSKDTRGNKKSPWDTLHPGRAWADATEAEQKPKSQILGEIAAHFNTTKIFRTQQDIFAEFMRDMAQLPTTSGENIGEAERTEEDPEN